MQMPLRQAMRHPYPVNLICGAILVPMSALFLAVGSSPLAGNWWLWFGGGVVWALGSFLFDCAVFPVGEEGLRVILQGMRHRGWRGRPWGLTSCNVMLLLLPHICPSSWAYYLATAGLGVGLLAGCLWWYPRWRLLGEAYARASANPLAEGEPGPQV